MFVLALKANHPTLHSQVKNWFDQAQAHNFEGIKFSYDYRLEKGHHRLEKRWCWAVPLEAFGGLYQQQQWLGLKSIVMVKRIRHLWNKTTHEVQFGSSRLCVIIFAYEIVKCLLGKTFRTIWLNKLSV